MATVFLTGASGFVGKQVYQRLQRRGHRVNCLRRGSFDNAHSVRGDLLNPKSYEGHLANIEVVIHLAAVTGKAPPPQYSLINLEGTRAILEAALRAKVNRFLFCSSIAVKFPDQHRYYYAQSKAAAERVVMDSGINATVIRPTIVAGRGSSVMNRLASYAALPLVPAIGGARARVQPIHVDDLADFVVDIVESDRFHGEILELGGPEVIALRSLLDRLRRRLTGGPARFLPIPLAGVLPVLALLEPLAYSAIPITIGQLATFRFDGVATPNTLWNSRKDRLAPVELMIAEASAA